MPAAIHVTAPSRLHFGLMNFGGDSNRQFGGVGLMVDEPGMRLRLAPAARFEATEPLAGRVTTFAQRWLAYHRLEELPACRVEVLSAPREHIGLGVGTQLGMSLAAGLSRFIGLPEQTPLELAVSVGRGQRSAVGAYGFVLGGLIAERGKLQSEPVSPLDCHLHLPAAWRVMLICPQEAVGLASDDEVQAFARLPPVPDATTTELTRIAREQLLPAAASGDFNAFSQAVFAYGHLSGECFAALQGGPYNGPRLAAIVAKLRALGVVGVGQSSWGPTIFALLPDAADAARLQAAIVDAPEMRECDVVLTTIARSGARID
jgi:beta-ribofuranosylaminobenzene 5'-phosphate synthase